MAKRYKATRCLPARHWANKTIPGSGGDTYGEYMTVLGGTYRRMPGSGTLIKCGGRGKKVISAKRAKTGRGRKRGGASPAARKRGRSPRRLSCYGKRPSTRIYKSKVKCSKKQKVGVHYKCAPGAALRGGKKCKPNKVLRVKGYSRCKPVKGRGHGQRRGRRQCKG